MTRFCVHATWHDVPHLSEAQKASLWEAIPRHQRDARTKGIPILGSGRVFLTPEEKIICEPFDVPRSFARITGVDFGIDHPFAAARCACHAADLRHADQNGDCGSQTDAINAGDQVEPLGQIVVLPNCADQALEFAVQEALEPADLLLPELPDTLVAARLTAGFELR